MQKIHLPDFLCARNEEKGIEYQARGWYSIGTGKYGFNTSKWEVRYGTDNNEADVQSYSVHSGCYAAHLEEGDALHRRFWCERDVDRALGLFHPSLLHHVNCLFKECLGLIFIKDPWLLLRLPHPKHGPYMTQSPLKNVNGVMY
jgi:hypothetical protein